MKSSIFRLIVVAAIMLFTDIALWPILSGSRIIAMILSGLFYFISFCFNDDRDIGIENGILAVIYAITLPTLCFLIPDIRVGLFVLFILFVIFLTYQELIDAFLIGDKDSLKYEINNVGQRTEDNLFSSFLSTLFIPLAMGCAAIGIKSCYDKEKRDTIEKTGVIIGVYSEIVNKDTQYTFIIKPDSTNTQDTVTGYTRNNLFLYKKDDSVRYKTYDGIIKEINKIE